MDSVTKAAVEMVAVMAVALVVAMVGLRRVAMVVAVALVVAMVAMVVVVVATRSLSSVSVVSEFGKDMLRTVLGFWARLLRWTARCGHRIVLLRGLLLLPSRRAIERL